VSERKNWEDDLDIAITVVDFDGTIERMNPKAQATFEKYGGGTLIGQSVFNCHPEHAVQKIKNQIDQGKPNHYTITKNGQKKIIHQIPRLRDGKVVGVVEISVPIPEQMPHFVRD
jgi:DUF438 domain-containing protein